MARVDFCTYFDQHYLARGLALYDSLQRHCPNFRLWILCMDDAAHAKLSQMALLEVELIRLEDFEAGDAGLAVAKTNRSRIEYYFTCSASLPLFIFRQDASVDLLTYLDADMYFFADPAPVFEQLQGKSIGITAHRLPPAFRWREQYGLYNVGWLSFRRDPQGLACLQRWREQCIEWCYDKLEDNRYADQKYLDEWPTLYPDLIVLPHKGVNLAPWNVANYELRQLADGQLMVDDEPLILYHFHGLKQKTHTLFDPRLYEYEVALSPILRNYVYAPYVRRLINRTNEVSSGIRASTQERSEGPFARLEIFLRNLRNLLLGRYLRVNGL